MSRLRKSENKRNRKTGSDAVPKLFTRTRLSMHDVIEFVIVFTRVQLIVKSVEQGLHTAFSKGTKAHSHALKKKKEEEEETRNKKVS